MGKLVVVWVIRINGRVDIGFLRTRRVSIFWLRWELGFVFVEMVLG